jgi:hypothetical protein
VRELRLLSALGHQISAISLISKTLRTYDREHCIPMADYLISGLAITRLGWKMQLLDYGLRIGEWPARGKKDGTKKMQAAVMSPPVQRQSIRAVTIRPE